MSVGKMDTLLECPVCRSRHVPLTDQVVDGVYAASCQQCDHFFKFKVTQAVRSEVKVKINGISYTVDNSYNPATSLNEFLRDTRASMATKYMCREGGCGLCVVMATVTNPATQKQEQFSLNACLCPVFMCDGWSITTVEGIGNTREGLHPIQSRLYKYNGSQCGFCSPAQVMNMYALLQNDSEPSMQKVEDAFDGIICRCTGYRPILDAMKSFADDKCITDIEDMNLKTCKKTGKKCSGDCSNTNGNNNNNTTDLTPVTNGNGSYGTTLTMVTNGNGRCGSTPPPLHMVLQDAQWFKPVTLTQLYDLLKQYKGQEVRLVFGSTGSGVYKDIGPWMYEYLIDLHGIPELYQFSLKPALQIGANVTITRMLEILSDPDVNTEDGYQYLTECVTMLKRIAHTNVRNAGSWAGNIMMKHKHPEFQSDMFVLLETVGAQIYINGSQAVSPSQLLNTDMSGNVLTHMVLPKIPSNNCVKFYKVAKRIQNCHSYVSGGFKMYCEKSTGFVVIEHPVFVYNGINNKFVHATATEDYLIGKKLWSLDVLQQAIILLRMEVQPDVSDPLAGGFKFRQDLAKHLFYRFVLHIFGDAIGSPYRSGSYPLVRPLSSGSQTYDTHKQEWPLSEPLLKLEGKSQVSGEAVYINDLPAAPGQLHAAFAVTDVGNAKISNIDISAAMAMQGVKKVILAADIPGVNNAMPAPYAPEEVLCSGKVMYAGQAVAIVVADNEETAYTAARAVKVKYTDVQPPVLTIADAVEKGLMFPKQADDIIVGDPDAAIAHADHVISGKISCGTQYHYSMETQISVCVPTEDGMKVYASSQWIDYAQKSVAQVLGMPCASVDVEVKRLGGAYGSKISRNFAIASACAVAANSLNRPVKFNMSLHTNMENVGKRFPYLAKYQVGFQKSGKLMGIKVTYYCDCGFALNDCTVHDIMEMGDNAYYCPNWHMVPVAVQTNTPSNTYCRAPASTPGIFVMETMIDHVAKTLDKDPLEVKKLNLYQKGQVTPGGMTLTYCSITSLVQKLEGLAAVSTRQKQIDTFNKANIWKKKGLSVVPLKYGAPWNTQNYGINMAVYSQDGTVAVSHGGIEVGQGINTKVAQVCAYELGIGINLIKVKPTNTFTSAGSCFTGSSVTSELVCQSVINACKVLNERIAPVKAKMKDPTWLQIVAECYVEGIDLAVHSWYKPHTDFQYAYNSYGATCTEVELDVLTGEHQITRVDILFDCGESINPLLDIGQVEGAFVMGIGYWLLEESIYDQTTGKYLTNGTWNYKTPSTKDIPIDFRITLLKDAPNPIGILRSKLSGEPPLCMSCSVLFAVKHAIYSARTDYDYVDYFPLNGPATIEVIQQACMTRLETTATATSLHL